MCICMWVCEGVCEEVGGEGAEGNETERHAQTHIKRETEVCHFGFTSV